MNTLNNSLTRRLFRISIILFALKKILTLYNNLTNIDYFEVNIVINKTLILKIYNTLNIKLISLLKSKPF